MFRKTQVSPTVILYLFILFNLLVGGWIAPDYGKSTDEGSESNRSGLALQAYISSKTLNLAEEYQILGLVQYYGTASTTLIRFVEAVIFPNTDHGRAVVAHYLYFLFFQGAVASLFYLAKCFMDEWRSLFTALLFGSQPLLFGHAFINPKDIPLLFVFILTVTLGFYLVDRWQSLEPSSTSPKSKQNELVFLGMLSLLLVFLWSRNWITSQILNLVEYGFTTKGQSLVGKLFAYLTTSGSLKGYLTLTNQYLYRGYRVFYLITPLLLIALFLLFRKKGLFGGKVNLFLLLAGAAWGFAISTRAIAIAAGGIVGLYGLIKLKKQAVFPLAIYTITAGITSYITWPYLWAFGLKGLIKSLTVFGTFPRKGTLLFEGQLIEAGELPARYVPELLTLQFTLPMVLLALAGMLLGIYLIYKKKTDGVKLILLYAWFLLPLFYTMSGRTTNYSNFRQYIFITPPLFIFAGITFQQISNTIKSKPWVLAAAVLVLLPGFYSIIHLHPFQYIYYNQLVGGVGGAYHNYELDYWGLAYKDAMDYVNENIPPESNILFWKNDYFGRIYAEHRYHFTTNTEIPEEEYTLYDYAVITTTRFYDEYYLVDYPAIHTVDVDGASLIVIKQIRPDMD